MPSLHAVVELNNHGARLLCSGHTLAALRLIRQAAFAITELSRSSEDQVAGLAAHPVPPSSMSLSALTSETDQSIDKAQQHDGYHVGSFYVYSRPLLVPVNIADSQQDKVVDIVSTYLIFNLALACHRFGIETGTTESLDRAMDLYHILLESLCHMLPETTGTDNGSCNDHDGNGNGNGMLWNRSLLQCVVLNNLAQLYHYQCAYDGCDWYMACLDHIVQANTQCLQDANDARLLSAYEVEEIQLNLVFGRPPPVAHAA